MAQTALAVLREAIDELFAQGAADVADGQSMVELHRQCARLEAFTTRAVGAFDEGGAWADDGAASPVAWLTNGCGLARAQARREVARSRHLRHLPVTEAAYEQGQLTTAHVDALIRFDRPPTGDVLARDEALLVDQAAALSFAEFTRVLAYWDQFADPDGTEARAEQRRCRRNVTLTESVFGTWLGSVTLDPISGTIVATELDRLEETLFEADWAEAKDRLGRDPLPHQLARTSAQRRADALVEMATRSKQASATARRPTPLFTVLVDYPTLAGRMCQLAQGSVVTPGSLLRYLDQATVERAVFGPDDRVEMGHSTRLFKGATRRAVEVRDRVCQHPFCDLTADRCQVDHIHPASQGGPTTQANGRLLCPFHNRLAWREHVAAQSEGRAPPDDG